MAEAILVNRTRFTSSLKNELMKDFEFKPSTTIEEGLSRFAEWFLQYYA